MVLKHTITLVVAVLLAYAAFEYLNSDGNEYLNSDGSMTEIKKVRMVATILPGEMEISQIIKRGRPVIIKGAVKHWEALYKWKPVYDSVTQSVKLNSTTFPDILANISKHYDKFFTYFQPQRPMSTLREVIPLKEQDPKKVTMPTNDFINTIFNTQTQEEKNTLNSTDKSYFYFSTRLKEFSKDLYEDIKPIEFFYDMMESSKSDKDAIEQMKLLLWMGSKGVITRLHFDWSFNFHAMFHGRKIFQLYSPAHGWDLCLYPYLHPRATKSQASFFHNTYRSERYEQTKNYMQMFEAEIEAGDVLYLPPLWFHQVESIESSISLSMWSECLETSLITYLNEIGMPFPPNYNSSTAEQEEKLALVMMFLDTLLSAALAKNAIYPFTTAQFAKEIERSRYEPLYTEITEIKPHDKFICPNRKDASRKYGSYYATAVRETFEPIVSAVPRPRLDIWLADYVEVVLYSAVPLTDMSSALLCFSRW